MTKKELAIAYHDKGYNCAQAVVCAFSEELGVSHEVLFKAADLRYFTNCIVYRLPST